MANGFSCPYSPGEGVVEVEVMPTDDDLVLMDGGQESLRTRRGPSANGVQPLWSKGVTSRAPIEAGVCSSSVMSPCFMTALRLPRLQSSQTFRHR